jgi:hypothetical protein
MAVAPFFPALGPVLEVQAREHAVIEAIEEPVARNEVGELGFHAARQPDLAGGEGVVGLAFELEQFGADAVAAGEQDVMRAGDHRDGDVGVAAAPGIFPEHPAVIRCMRSDLRGVEDQDLRLSRQLGGKGEL